MELSPIKGKVSLTHISRKLSKNSKVTIIHGDSEVELNTLAENSVDLIISSPPYCMGKVYENTSNVEEFVRQHNNIVPLLVSRLKSGGSICWQTGYHVGKNGVVPLDWLAHEVFSQQEGLTLRNRIIWIYGHGPHCKNRLSGRHETVLWYSKGSPHFDLDSIRIPQKYPGKRHYKGNKKGLLSGNPLGKNPSDVWEIPNVNASHVEKTSHPCQFPVALVQRLVRALSPTMGLVLDPFAGSSSTGVGALIEGRKYIGIEKESKYCEISVDRLKQVLAGEVKFRDISKPISQPKTSHQVAQKPPHFA